MSGHGTSPVVEENDVRIITLHHSHVRDLCYYFRAIFIFLASSFNRNSMPILCRFFVLSTSSSSSLFLAPVCALLQQKNPKTYLETRTMSSDCNHCNKSMKLSFCPFSAFLFASSAAAYTSYLARKAKKTSQKKFDVVFILGGPVRIFAYPLSQHQAYPLF